jgi:hypothetical protein
MNNAYCGLILCVIERPTGAGVGSDQIAEIAPGVREALAGGPSWRVTFEISGDPNRWVQFTAGTINAAYPMSKRLARVSVR